MMAEAGSFVLILDFGSAYTGALIRTVRELGVVCELRAADSVQLLDVNRLPSGVVISGGLEMFAEGLALSTEFLRSCQSHKVPLLAISYGMVAVCKTFGANLGAVDRCHYKPCKFHLKTPTKLFEGLPSTFSVFANVENPVSEVPADFVSLGQTFDLSDGPLGTAGALYNEKYNLHCVFFHPECLDTEHGVKLLSNFLYGICGSKKSWTMESYLEKVLLDIAAQCGSDKHVVAGLSGGVDSTVSAALVHKVIGSRFHGVMVDTGLMRHDEIKNCYDRLKREIPGIQLLVRDSSQVFFKELANVVDPEQKRKIIGRVYIEEFEDAILKLGLNESNCFLLQGTIYPDILESELHRLSKTPIKSHHNVGGLPEKMKIGLIEPVRYLFKEEVRALAKLLNFSNETVVRQPFPGPGLGIRVIGELTPDRVGLVRAADRIVREEFDKYLAENPDAKVSQVFCVLLSGVKSTGIVNGQRVYGHTIVVRSVHTTDFVTAKWSVVHPDLLARVSTRITTEVDGVNRVCYDITNKGPATIEWE